MVVDRTMTSIGITIAPHDNGFPVMRKIEELLREAARTNHLHLIRTLTPQNFRMVLSLSKGPGQEKIFEIFISGHPNDEDISEVLVLVHRDYCPNLYTLIWVNPDEECAEILFHELYQGDERMPDPEFFFCNWFTSPAGDDMASMSFAADNQEDFLHFGALVDRVVKCIMEMSVSDDEDTEDMARAPRGRFVFSRSPAQH